jgi:hypothetical protein
MKSILTLLVGFLLFTNTSFSQCTKKGDIDGKVGFGFGIYNLANNDETEQNSGGVPGLITLSSAYALGDRWSLGLQYERNGFLTNKDSSDAARSHNLGLAGTYRFVNREKVAFYVDLILGISSFTYEKNQINGTLDKVTSSGSNLQLGLGMKQYFGQHIGWFWELAFTNYSYKKFTNKDGDVLKTDDGKFNNLEIKMTGGNLRVGVCYKF